MNNEEEEKKPKEKLRYKVPKTIGGAIDLLNAVRTERKKLQGKAESEKRQEGMIEEKILAQFGKSDLEGARGKTAQCSIKRSDVPTIEDFDKVWSYARKNDRPDLFQRRLSVEAVRLLWADKKTVPGVGTFTKVSLNLTKI